MAMRETILPFVAAAALLSACEARVGGEDEAANGGSADSGTVEGSSEEGTFSLDLPGFEMKVDIPEGLQEQARIDGNGDLLPPGATFRGMHVRGEERGESGVEMRFSDARAPAELAAWYRSEGTGRDYTITSAREEGDGFVLAGETRQDRDTFTIRLAPRAGGGTDGTLAIVDRSG